jgi:molecular chaperone GrpE (heat shock protein)
MTTEFEQLELILTRELSQNLELKNKVREKDLEKQDLMKDFFLGIIKVLDSFESKEDNLTEKFQNQEPATLVIQSYSSIKKQLLNLLSKYGVTLLEFPENRLIVGYSKVVDTEPDQSKKNDTIISIVKNGYIRGSELIREAEIIIVKN